MVEVHLGVIRPEFPANLFPRHHVARMLEQHCKDSIRLFGKTDGVTTIPAKLTGTKIKFEVFEPNHTTRASYFLHATSPSARILALVYARYSDRQLLAAGAIAAVAKHLLTQSTGFHSAGC